MITNTEAFRDATVHPIQLRRSDRLRHDWRRDAHYGDSTSTLWSTRLEQWHENIDPVRQFGPLQKRDGRYQETANPIRAQRSIATSNRIDAHPTPSYRAPGMLSTDMLTEVGTPWRTAVQNQRLADRRPASACWISMIWTSSDRINYIMCELHNGVLPWAAVLLVVSWRRRATP